MGKQKNDKDDNFLLYIPRKKHDNWEIRKGRVWLIFNHDKTVEKFMRWLVKKPTTSDVELDAIGSSVWKNIDGKATVYDIGQKLLYEFGDKMEPVYDRLIMYLRHLNKKGWISFTKENQSETK
ncbi:PqqD family protein [Candidatus Clostridium stratigraminis]|uniref:PqqD family protein n=1 Tax=Candidatus Clostridium stratigraminis TaxID=3381661 RepID=A0ABW8TA73_9CLOT